MEIITSHGNADFDSFAAMLCAQKLYPEAKIVFSGSKERALSLFLENPYYQFEEMSIKHVKPDKLSRIILVDVSYSSRIGPLAKLLTLPQVEIIVFDHHPVDKSDIRFQQIYVKPYGAVTTLLLELLRERDIPISKMEATIYAMGIYEDTGFLTYRTTTPEDVRQVAHLLECGADLAIVSGFLQNELSVDQISLLNDLIANAATYDINGVKIVISSASRDEYIKDAAAVVHKQMELERYSVYVAAVRMGDRIHLIGRSRHPKVDIGEVLKKMGGGGHAPAAYAVITGKTLVETIEDLIVRLEKTVAPAITARDVMTPDPFILGPNLTLNKAHSEMVRMNINTVPVKSRGKVIGIVTRQQLDKAIAHRLRGSLREIMNPEFSVISADAGIEEAERLIMEGTQRAVLVGENPKSIEGIITRMDLFRRLYIERQEVDAGAGMVRSRTRLRQVEIIEMLNKRLDPAIKDILKAASDVASERSENVFLVGGIVRDLILDYENEDVDLVVTGNGIDFAEALAKKLKGYSHPHSQFGTAVVVLPDGMHVDVVTARRESYPYPGALPQVETGSLRADLYRRDFTINSLAIDLTPPDFGRLIDYFGGMRDIQNRKIRILHGLSFIDDPTRILRAIRFASRLNFMLTDGTEQIMQSATSKKMLRRVSGKRILAELKLLLGNPRPLATIELLAKYSVLTAIHHKFKLDRFTRNLLKSLEETMSWFKLTFPGEAHERYLPVFMALTEKLTLAERRALGKRLNLPTKFSKALLLYKKQVKETIFLFRRKQLPSPSEITIQLDSMRLETILYAHGFANRGEIKEAVALYLSRYRKVKPRISGKDIVKLGVEPGPVFSRLIKLVRNARLDGLVHTKKEEIQLVKDNLSTGN